MRATKSAGDRSSPPPIAGFRPTGFIEESAGYWRDGVYAPQDFRYHAICEYLKLSPSFVAVSKAVEGKSSPFPLPKDQDAVRLIVNDFRQVLRMEPSDWWRKHGKNLYGVKAPAPTVYMAGRLTSKTKSLNVMWDGNNATVVRIAANQSKKDALKDLEKILDDMSDWHKPGKFGAAPVEQLPPKYTFLKSRLRQSALAMGAQVLSYYQSSQDFPLWWIGNFHAISPAHAITPADLAKMGADEIAHRKRILSIATSRVVKYALLVAENAARGRFPCSDPFPEAQVDFFQRTVGKPVGRKRKLS